jgi:hypothetical protein
MFDFDLEDIAKVVGTAVAYAILAAVLAVIVYTHPGLF